LKLYFEALRAASLVGQNPTVVLIVALLNDRRHFRRPSGGGLSNFSGLLGALAGTVALVPAGLVAGGLGRHAGRRVADLLRPSWALPNLMSIHLRL
jgi:hypothetical protein